MARENLLSIILSEIEERLDVLRPALAEHEQLLVALAALEAGAGSKSRKDSRSSSRQASAALTARTRHGARAGAREASSGRSSGRGARAASSTRASAGAKERRAPRGAAREAILAALEHGSHTVSELVVVTAMSGPNVNGNLRRLLSEGAIAKTEREGKTAYALSE